MDRRELRRLQIAYSVAVANYTQAQRELDDLLARNPNGDHIDAFRNLSVVRKTMNDARTALDRHRAAT